MGELSVLCPVRTLEKRNIVVLSGRSAMARILLGDTTYSGAINYGALGTDSTSPAASDTALGAEVARKLFARRTRTDAQVSFDFFFSQLDTSGTYEEFGMFIDGDAERRQRPAVQPRAHRRLGQDEHRGHDRGGADYFQRIISYVDTGRHRRSRRLLRTELHGGRGYRRGRRGRARPVRQQDLQGVRVRVGVPHQLHRVRHRGRIVGASVPVNDTPIVAEKTGLTSGAMYYLSDTQGAIATSTPPAPSSRIGRATSTTRIKRPRGRHARIRPHIAGPDLPRPPIST